ncbi:hypothetical protein [Bacillus paramycoides]
MTLLECNKEKIEEGKRVERNREKFIGYFRLLTIEVKQDSA